MANEKRLIDANALDEKLEILKVRYKAQGRDNVAEDYNFVQTVLLTAPTVDAVEVVHGRNLKEEWPSLFKCSVCGCDSIDTYSFEPSVINYCPNCGAKMDGDGNAID